MIVTQRFIPRYERVLFGEDPAVGYRGIIAIHSTVRGPACGGTRFWAYSSQEEALQDVLRLARGMTYKNALAGLPLGGGKSVIIGDNKSKFREKIFRLHGRFVHLLQGQYNTCEDVGTSPADMEYVLQETPYVRGLQGRSGDPSPRTAQGVFRAMQASARHRWGTDSLKGKRIAIQGCGHVGYHLAEALHRAGARLLVADVDPEKAERAVCAFGAAFVSEEEIYSVEADVFAPCALGGILNDQTIPRLKAEIVCGCANNQLLEPRHGDLLHERGILYAPDYAANAGGIINGCCIEILGWDVQATIEKVDGIYNTLLQIFEMARHDGIPTWKAANRLAEQQVT